MRSNACNSLSSTATITLPQISKSIPSSFYGEVPLFYQLIKVALQTDSTRVISLAINGWGGSSGLPGVTKGYHDITHHGRDETLTDSPVSNATVIEDLLA